MTRDKSNAKKPELILNFRFGPGNLGRLESALRERRTTSSSDRESTRADDAEPAKHGECTGRKQRTPTPTHSILNKGKSELDENGHLAEYYLSLKVYSCDPRDSPHRDDLLEISPGKLNQHICNWESRIGVVSKQHPDDEQVHIPPEAKYLLVTEKTHGGYQFPVIMFCEKLNKLKQYERNITQLRPVVAIFFDQYRAVESFPSLIEQMDSLCATNPPPPFLHCVEKACGSTLVHRPRWNALNELLERAAIGEKKKSRKFDPSVVEPFTRWVVNVEKYFEIS